MKELFKKLERIQSGDKVDYLVDTCFFVWVLEHTKVKHFTEFLNNNIVAMTSFNIEEFVHIDHKISDDIRESARKFLHKSPRLYVLELDVHPGNSELEHAFVRSVLPELDVKEHDPSDAVILAAAIKSESKVLTRDKHHLFNVQMENFLNKHNVEVLNKFS